MNKPACYLCGATDKKLTQDHLPPKSFFPKPRPTNLITVPCCEQCNKGLSLDDEAFRVWIASSRGVSNAGMKIFKEEVIGSSFARSPKLLENVRKHVQVLQLRTAGQTFPVTAITIPQDRAKSFLVRLTKGLLTHFYPEYDYRQDAFFITVLAPIKEHLKRARELARCLVRDSRGDGVFDFWRNIIPDGNGGAWICLFYDAVCCEVIHVPRARWEKKWKSRFPLVSEANPP